MVPLLSLVTALLLTSMLTISPAFATGADTQQHTARVPSASQLNVSAYAKTLTFRWARVPDATHYILMGNPDGHSGFVPIGSAIPARATHKAIGIPAHLLNWDRATYFLSACNRIGCTASNMVRVVELETQAVGVIQRPEGSGRGSYGMVLSGDGKILAVGDPHFGASADEVFVGAVFVYRKSPGGWQLEAKLQPPTPLLSDEFGSALSISADGRTLAIGAGQSGTPRMGTVYVFVRAESAWIQQAQLSPTPAQSPSFGGVLFGAALDLSAAADVLVVGAPFEPLVTQTGVLERAGVVYVFRRKDPTRAVWQLTAKLSAPAAQEDDRFGAAVTLSGNGRRLIALAGEQNNVTETPEDDYRDRINTLHAFSAENSGWRPEAAIEAPPGSTFFGGSGHDPAQIINDRALDIDWRGNVFAVGVGQVFEQPHLGEVRIYERDHGSWSLTNRLTPPPGREGFGDVLALSASGRVLAARALETQGQPEPSVVVLTHSQGAWVERAVLTSPAPLRFSRQPFGRALALSHGGRTLAVGAITVSEGFIFIY